MMVPKKLLMASVLFVLFFSGCISVNEDLSATAAYAPIVGKTYRTKERLLVYAFRSEPRILSVDQISPLRGFPSAEDLFSKPFPYNYSSMKIYGVLPAGSLVRLKKVAMIGSIDSAYDRLSGEVTVSSDETLLHVVFYLHPLKRVSLKNGRSCCRPDPAYFEEVVRS